MTEPLEGRTVVVTGVTSGIGAALCARLVGAGATVLGVARDAARVAATAERLGARFVPFVADLADPDAREQCVREIGERAARVDALVNNAAECVYELPSTFPVDRMRALLEVNLLAAIELCQGLRPRMESGSHVVNVSSVTARFVPNPKFAPYGLTKAALDAFTDALRLELDPAGIKVTSIVPGLVDTPIYDKVQGFAKTRAKIAEQLPTWLAADDVAEAILWALTRPPHVVVGELVLLPRGQAR